MTLANATIIFALLILLAIVAMLFLGSRFKRNKTLSPLTGLALALIVAGIFFGDNRMLGFSLLGAGIILAVSDIMIKARNNRNAEKDRQQAAFGKR